APSTPTTATRRPRAGNAPTTTHQAPTLWRSTLRRSRTGNARARGADRPRGHPHLGQQLHPRHRTLLWNTPSTPTTASTTTQSSASRRAHIIEHTKSQPHRQPQRPRTGHSNDPILCQRITHAIEHGKSPLHRHHERPATTLTTTQSSANNHAHNLEHPYDPRHQQQPRPHAGNTPATQHPAPRLWRKTLRRSRTGDARQGGADRSRDHPTLDHQARPQPRIPTKPTPSTTTTASTTTHTTASSHAHIVEHHRSPRHQQR